MPLMKGLRKEMKNPLFSDISVKVGEKNFSCHKVVLATTSPYFEDLFLSGVNETKENEVTIEGITPDVFDLLLKWMYHGDFILSKDSVFDILRAADQLRVESLLPLGKEFVKKIISADNCDSVFELSHRFDWHDLKKVSLTFMIEKFDRVNLADLSVFSLEELKSLISNPKLVTKSENFVVQAVLKWVTQHTSISNEKEKTGNKQSNFDQWTENRGAYMADLLDCCRYLHLSTNFVLQTLDRFAFVQSNRRCQTIIQEILRYKFQPDTHQHWCHKAALHRPTSPQQDVVMAISEKTIVVSKIQGFCRGWHTPAFDFPVLPRCFTGGAFYDGQLYIEVFEEKGRQMLLCLYDPIRHEIFKYQERENYPYYQTFALLPIQDSLVAVRVSAKGIIVETLNMKGTVSPSWEVIGSLTTKGMTPVCITSIDTTLVIVWRAVSSDSLTIECFDTDRCVSFLLPKTLKASSCVVSFKKDDQVFLLQSDGLLWRVQSLVEAPFVDVVQVVQLWNGLQEFKAAMIVSDKLCLFRSPEKQNIKWCTRVLEGVFLKVFTVVPNGSVNSLIHAVLHQKAFPNSG